MVHWLEASYQILWSESDSWDLYGRRQLANSCLLPSNLHTPHAQTQPVKYIYTALCAVLYVYTDAHSTQLFNLKERWNSAPCWSMVEPWKYIRGRSQTLKLQTLQSHCPKVLKERQRQWMEQRLPVCQHGMFRVGDELFLAMDRQDGPAAVWGHRTPLACTLKGG